MEEGRTLFVTVHPSYLLRLADIRAKEAEMARFRMDMEIIRKFNIFFYVLNVYFECGL